MQFIQHIFNYLCHNLVNIILLSIHLHCLKRIGEYIFITFLLGLNYELFVGREIVIICIREDKFIYKIMYRRPQYNIK